MEYVCRFYKEGDYDGLMQLVLASYQWEYPIVGLSRLEFSKGLHPIFVDARGAWEHTVGVFCEGEKIVACVWNEGQYCGDLFFLFDSKERGEDQVLLKEMLKFAKTYGAEVKEDKRTRYVNVFIPKWHTTLQELVLEQGFERWDWTEKSYIVPFKGEKLKVKLPEGYSIIDGHTSPDFYLANIHRLSFANSGESYACKHGEEAFHELRTMKYYNKSLDLCVLNPQKQPVAMAMMWYEEGMPYCELEPLAVVWWERRKGIATAILNEATNRITYMYPQCKGMKGGDQAFYTSIGYEKRGESTAYHWEKEVFISWEPESINHYYGREGE